MAFIDLPLEQLRQYCPPREEPADFDAFWARTLRETAEYPLDAQFEPFDAGLTTIDVYDVRFRGYKGQEIRGWLMLPHHHNGRIPCIVEYIGYGGGRGEPIDWLVWSSAGYAHLVMDTRGQGAAWSRGATPDVEETPVNPQGGGFLTRGIFDPDHYFYRRLFTDAVRAVEVAANHPAVDAARIAVTGGSQGGGITLAVSGLSTIPSVVMPDVPFLCHYRHASHITDSHPYQELVEFCKVHRDRIAQVFRTLSYFDGVNLAARAKGRALFSVGLMDPICPPSTVFAAFNHYGGEKDIRVWEYNMHEGGGSQQTIEKMRFLKALWA